MIIKPFFDQSNDLIGNLVRLPFICFGNIQMLFRCFAVLIIVIPLSALWFITIHKDVVFPAHLAVEELHPQLFTPIGPILKLLVRRKETIIRP